MKRLCVIFSLALTVFFPCVTPGLAQEGEDRKSPSWLLPLDEVQLDDNVPTLKDIVGHTWGEDISSHAEIERYLHVLAASTKDRTRLESYGESYEGRRLYYLVITSPDNLQ